MKKLQSIILTIWVYILFSFYALAVPAVGEVGAPNDPRYCGEPKRDSKGAIVRSQTVLNAFTKVFPCPANMLSTTACIGWAIDHTIPLSMGGCDSAINLTWLPDQIKSCAGQFCKDRWERKYHAFPRQIIRTAP